MVRTLLANNVLILLIGYFALSCDAIASDVDSDAEQLFVRRVAPLFHEKCLACHGRDETAIKGGFDIRTLQSTLRGGDSETPSLVLGKPEESPLNLAATRNHDVWAAMPPKEADKLNADQLDWIRQWIAGGAPWPDESRVAQIAKENAVAWSDEDGVIVATAGALSKEWANRRYNAAGLWAYQKVKLQSQSTSLNGSQVIDALIRDRMPDGLEPAPLADRVTLIRRATFDLTGLPPKPEEVDAFVKDTRVGTEAFSVVLERLLASPHYGERMAQHWLDVVRYADSSGFANDYERGNAWRYRDYVVNSFNQDKPYDRFVREQIAGDEMEPTDPEMIIATGFLRMGPWELTGMEVAKIARQRFLDDVVNSVGETFLAHSLQCARCHDHKFDPVPTHDYYSIQAVFATTQIVERATPFLDRENMEGFDERKFLEMRRDDYLSMLAKLDEQLIAAAQVWFLEKGLSMDQWNRALETVTDKTNGQSSSQKNKPKRREFSDRFSAIRSLLLKEGIHEDQFPPKYVGFTPQDYGNERVARKGLERLKWELERFEPFSLAVYSGRTPKVTSVFAPLRIPNNRLQEGELEATCILNGGDPFGLGQPVTPGVLSVLGEVQTTAIPIGIEGRRKAFSEWVASKENPLTTRAIVNRIWQWHFDRAIAGNANNFGSAGKRPTHPELLDWLAAAFVEQGWSFKAMHRIIMNSETYRRGASYPSPGLVAEKDPLGTSYAVFKPRRLTAEELRDAMLAATGELNPTVGGIPNRPEINLEAAFQPRQVMGTFAAAWTPNPLPQQRHRRSIYALKLRGLTDPLLEVFNSPAPDFSCERREASTITPQVFSLFNSQSIHDRALALANRAVKEKDSDDEAIARCFELVYARRPRIEELQLCIAHWRSVQVMLAGSPTEPKEKPLEVLRNAVEENTGEKFSFREKLHAYSEFIPDLQASSVDVRTCALADVCLVLFNSNEFSYAY